MTRKLIAKKHVRVPAQHNTVRMESHSDGQRDGYFPRTMWALLSSLGFGDPHSSSAPPRLLHGNTYLWLVHVIIYERSTTNRICRIHQVVEASTPRWTFEGGMRNVVREALVILRHEEDDQMEHSEYRHFLSHTREGAEAVVLPAGDRDRIGCFVDQVKLTRALVQDLDEAIKEVKLLGEHGEEASWRITELKALCMKYAEDAQKLREEKTKLEGMAESRDELIMEFADKYGYNCSDED
jgi:hypothetical protein